MRPCRCFALPPNKNRLAHDGPRKGQKTAYKPCTKTEKRVNGWITN
nr:MAG TPA: hypothetical protein [Caudoviricetes sp.]